MRKDQKGICQLVAVPRLQSRVCSLSPCRRNRVTTARRLMCLPATDGRTTSPGPRARERLRRCHTPVQVTWFPDALPVKLCMNASPRLAFDARCVASIIAGHHGDRTAASAAASAARIGSCSDEFVRGLRPNPQTHRNPNDSSSTYLFIHAAGVICGFDF